MGKLCVILCVVVGVVWGDPKQFTVYSIRSNFRSPPVGFGPAGGVLRGSVSVDGADWVQLSVLSDEQMQLWKRTVDETVTSDVRDDELVSYDANPKVSTYQTFFQNDEKNFELSIVPAAHARRFFVFLIFPPGADSTVSGELQLDWQQHEGGGFFLQYQYLPLARGLEQGIIVLTVLSSFYLLQFMLPRLKAVTKIHFFYLFAAVYSVVYLVAWAYSAQLENTTGDRNSFLSKWFPSLLQKGFDIVEVLVYLLSALGWQIMRPSLTPGEVQIITAGVLLSLLLGIFEIACGDDELLCSGYSSARMVIHMFGYLTGIMTFNFYLALAQTHVGEFSIASVDASRLYQKWHCYKWFRNVFFLFVTQPTLAVILRSDVIGWEDDWIFMLFFWFSKIGMMAAIAVVFRPQVELMAIVKAAITHRQRSG